MDIFTRCPDFLSASSDHFPAGQYVLLSQAESVIREQAALIAKQSQEAHDHYQPQIDELIVEVNELTARATAAEAAVAKLTAERDGDGPLKAALELATHNRKRAVAAEDALAEVSKERDEFARCLDGGVDCARDRIAAEARESALREALQEYGSHKRKCYVFDAYRDNPQCDCGYSAAIAQCPAVKG